MQAGLEIMNRVEDGGGWGVEDRLCLLPWLLASGGAEEVFRAQRKNEIRARDL